MSFPSHRSFLDFDVVCLAASLGGIEVLKSLVTALPPAFPAPVMIVQHIAPHRPSLLREILAYRSRLPVHEADDECVLLPGHVYVAPPGRHLEIDGDFCSLTDRDRVNFSRQSADVLFKSASLRFGPRVLGIVLTGLLHDGALGAAAIRASGGVVIAQEPASCVAPGMPLAAIREGVDFVLDPAQISRAMIGLVSVPGVAAMFGVGRHRQVA